VCVVTAGRPPDPRSLLPKPTSTTKYDNKSTITRPSLPIVHAYLQFKRGGVKGCICYALGRKRVRMIHKKIKSSLQYRFRASFVQSRAKICRQNGVLRKHTWASPTTITKLTDVFHRMVNLTRQNQIISRHRPHDEVRRRCHPPRPIGIVGIRLRTRSRQEQWHRVEYRLG